MDLKEILEIMLKYNNQKDIGNPTAIKVNWNYHKIGKRIIEVQELPRGTAVLYDLNNDGYEEEK